MHFGSCLCGAVKFSAGRLVGPYVYCHCPSCRKASGSSFAANISAPIDAFEITQGEKHIKAYESSPGKQRHFCSTCGAPLFTLVGKTPEVVRIRLGSLDTNFTETASAHIFTEQKAPWYAIEGDLTQYPAWPNANDLAIPGSRQRTTHDSNQPTDSGK